MRFGPAAILGLTVLPLAPPAAAAQARMMVVRTFPGRTDRVIADTMGIAYEVPTAAASAYLLLRQVYAELKVPLEVDDSIALEIGNARFIRRGDVGGRRISAYLECGGGMTGPYADFNRIDLTLMTFVAAAGADAAVIRTVLIGSAVNVSEGVRPTQGCYPTGELEKRIHQMLLKKLRG